MALVGYGRVSTQDQSLEAQTNALKDAGCTKIFCEKESGAKTNRKELAKAIASLNENDVLVVTRLDRASRSTLDLLTTLAACQQRGAAFRSLAESWCNTSTPTGKLLVTLLGAIAEWERSLILARTHEGRVIAKKKGVRFGRKLKLTNYQQAEVFERLERGDSHTAIAKSFNVHQTTISALVKKKPVMVIGAA